MWYEDNSNKSAEQIYYDNNARISSSWHSVKFKYMPPTYDLANNLFKK